YFAFRGQHFSDIRDAIEAANLWWLIPALVLYFGGVWIRVLRWRILLHPVVKVSARELYPIVVIGYMANNVLPLRTGEIVRAYTLQRSRNVPMTSSLATIAVERIFDGLTMLGFMLVATAFVSFTSQLRHLAIVAFIVFTVLVIGLFVLTLGGTFLDRLLQIVLGPMPTKLADRVEKLVESFLGGLAILRNWKDLTLVAAFSILAWGLEASMYYTLAQGFSKQLRDVMTPAATLLTTGVANMATLIPSSPGYIGQFEYGVKLVVNGALGVNESEALAYAIFVHAALFFPITAWGIFEWSRRQISFKNIQKLAEGDGQAAGAEVASSGSNVSAS
ncbi:MAG TPA: lysylphosphatidylglycerol synthase transmembrane domain-containing protein, partial [Thermomicrobiales bacterium]|nr:lysylphosphatidylglycerol synthase transmembrane domain-containing protein [Thermomicrobiales bacterium]